MIEFLMIAGIYLLAVFVASVRTLFVAAIFLMLFGITMMVIIP